MASAFVILFNRRTKRNTTLRNVTQIARDGVYRFKVYHGNTVTEFARVDYELVHSEGTIEVTDYSR